MNADLHVHMILDGVDFRAAIGAHGQAPVDKLIRQRLAAYCAQGVNYLRDGGDRWGVCRRAKALAPEYGITYRMPTAPIHRQGHYGAFLGRSWQDLADYRALVAQAAAQGADFIKLMVSGLMDFRQFGRLTEPPLDKAQITDLISVAHDAGFAVMVHCNGADAVYWAVEAGADSIEHGAYLDQEACYALARHGTVWVPTLSAVGNLLGCGRFPDEVLQAILDDTMEHIRLVARLGGLVGAGSDAGAFRVTHPQGIKTEMHWLRQALGEQADALLSSAAEAVRQRFVRR